MDLERIQLERDVLVRKLPSGTWHFCNLGSDAPFLALAARTNSGNLYTLHIELANFPDEIPAAYVSRMLLDRNGNALDSCNASMHVLSSDDGRTRICHYGCDAWTPRVSLYKIYIKCRLWLEMYELYLKTGKPIDYYLKHQA